MIGSIFKLVLTTSLYASIVGLVIILFKVILKNKINASWHYLIWIVLILKLLVPYGPKSVFSLFNVLSKVQQQSISRVSYQAAKQEPVYIQTENSTDSPMEQSEGFSITSVKNKNSNSYIWASGAVLMLCWLMLTYYTLLRKLQKGMLTEDERLVNIFNKCKTKMKINREIPLLLQEAVGTPSLFGIVNPKILLSPDVTSFSDKQLEYILLHELAHYKRKDVLVNYLLLALQIIHWFNPVIWYCFRCIRQDMEMAADEKVLFVLDKTEHKEYGNALITVLESFSSRKLAPKLIGMVDDKKNMEKRIRLIKMSEPFKKKRKIILLIGMLSITLLGCVSLTNGVSEPDAASEEVKALLKYKTPYVGNNSKVVNLIDQLSYADLRKTVSLQTKAKPYGITVNYDFSKVNMDTSKIEPALKRNATVLFALIDNVDVITFNIDESSVQPKYEYKREEIQKSFDTDLREYSKSEAKLKEFINSLDFKVYVFPRKYSPLMSSTPGIRMSIESWKPVSKVRYSVSNGTLFKWQSSTGEISNGKKTIELPADAASYWSPLGDESKKTDTKNYIVTITLYDNNGKRIDEKKVTFLSDDEMFYTVQDSPGVIIGSTTK